MRLFFKQFLHHDLGATCTRVLISSILMKDLIIYSLNLRILFHSGGIMPAEYFTAQLERCHLNMLNFLLQSPAGAIFFLILSMFLSVLFFCGIYKRTSGLLLFLCLWLFHTRYPFLMDGADNVIWIILPFLAFSNSHSLVKRKRQAAPPSGTIRGITLNHLSSLSTLGFALQLSLIYLFTAWSKITQEVWQNGTALYYILRLGDFKSSELNILLTEHRWFVVFATYLTLLWEFSFPFLIWFRPVRKYIILLSLFMHLGIFAFMRIDNFSFVMISCYPFLLGNDEIRELRSRISGLFLLKRRKNPVIQP
jgi:hypothetical protein